MGAFEYTALDTTGREQNGVVEGDTIKHVRQILRDRQLLPVTVAEVKHGEAKRDRSFSLRRGISAGDLSLLTRQLATLVKAGLPLEEALLADHPLDPVAGVHRDRHRRDQVAPRAVAGRGRLAVDERGQL